MSGRMTKQFKKQYIKQIKSLYLEKWIKYIAVDKDGDVYGYDGIPHADIKWGNWYVGTIYRGVFLDIQMKFDSTDWTKTLLCVDDMNKNIKVTELNKDTIIAKLGDLANSIRDLKNQVDTMCENFRENLYQLQREVGVVLIEERKKSK